MAELDYIRQYFTTHADAWIANAYVEADIAATYPLGNERVAAALNAVVERLGRPRGRLLDLGCGGGQLCFEAARLGLHATGVDVAEGMIDRCRSQTGELPPREQKRLSFRVADVLDTGFPDGQFDAITALGLIEYLSEDTSFLNNAYRLLRPGGVLVVTCRNRLFNLFSTNQYTQSEIEAGTAADLLTEVRHVVASGVTPESLQAWLRNLKVALPTLEDALRRDVAAAGHCQSRSGKRFAQGLRQHTPREITENAKAAGFAAPSFVGVHPHPLPPVYEQVAPHFFNALGRTLAIFADKPASLAWSSCFQAAFTKRLDLPAG